MADFADSSAAGLDLEPGQAKLYAGCELVAARAAGDSSANEYLTIHTRRCDTVR